MDRRAREDVRKNMPINYKFKPNNFWANVRRHESKCLCMDGIHIHGHDEQVEDYFCDLVVLLCGVGFTVTGFYFILHTS